MKPDYRSILLFTLLFFAGSCSQNQKNAPLFENIKVPFMFGVISHVDNTIISPDSRPLGELSPVSGMREKNKSTTALANLDDEKLNRWLKKSQTQVLLVQHRGEMVHESYSENSKRGLDINGFSMAKTVTALLIGIAIDEGKITSEFDNIKQYLPEIVHDDNDIITIRDLLQQQSGMSDPVSALLKTLKGQSLQEKLHTLRFDKKRSKDNIKEFKYSNVNYHLLTLVLQRAYQQEFNQILSEKLWQPLELEDARVVNNTGYCCIFASAHSWLSIGELFLNEGKHKENQIISKDWMNKIRNDKAAPKNFIVQLSEKSYNNFYSYHIFSGLDAYPNLYWSEGMGLQLLILSPETETIIVRLGDMASPLKLWTTRSMQPLLEVLNEKGYIKKSEHAEKS